MFKSSTGSLYENHMPVGFFSGLRNLARRLDHEVEYIEQQIESLQSNGNSSDVDVTHAKHFMQLARKGMKSLKSDVKITREDLKRRSTTVIQASELFTTLLNNYSERLESVETFMEKYGYVRPDVAAEDESLVDDSISENQPTVEVSVSSKISDPNFGITPGAEADPRCLTTNDESTPPVSNDGLTEISPRTPRLEDFGLSEYTLSLFSRKQDTPCKHLSKSDTICLDTACCNNTPDQIKQPDFMSSIHHDESMHTPVQTQKNGSSSSKLEMRTPQPEDFGLSSHLFSEHHDIPFSFGNDDEKFLYKDDFQGPDNLTPKLEQFFVNGESNCITSSFLQEQDNVSNNNKENMTSTLSPRTPEMPQLLVNRRPMPDCVFDKSTTPSNPNKSYGTPECPELHSYEPNTTEIDCLPQDISLLPTTGQTPPLPVLLPKKHYND